MRCMKCGRRYNDPTLYSTEGANARITAYGNRTRCPRPGCGGFGRQLIEGEFEVTPSGTWTPLASALANPEVTAGDLEKLGEIVRTARDSGVDKETLAEQLRSTLPRLAPVADFINSVHGDRLAVWLTVILTVLGPLIVAKSVPTPAPSVTTTVNVVVQQPGQEQIDELVREALAAQAHARNEATSPSRNSSCPCGSGRRYKRCHGEVKTRTHR